METLAFLFIISAWIYFLYLRRVNWQAILVGSRSEAEELQAKYEYLKDHMVNCRLRANTDVCLSAIQTAYSAIDQYRDERMKLEVHIEDVEKAEELLQYLEKKRLRHSFP
ncbi:MULTISPECIES: hypothetical protein [unclassified Paenibacillus]|uniref:hypothetical protein n=1 Tax=unclassified Paenibacillus TaxID=185978 RepID=UPI001AE147BE|nr:MULTISPECIES: hypothetical protein [unclassified Paenibacillus]MBP1153384.1 cell division protein FtsB [Paenibacillus sp. PvP091]MBP1171233.1 cell division protein FtsB [Paenibacillus sp. PvR098]MBP2442261.1 cell division protein FtsB [Paenibacillus sp. PvP052]